MLERRTSLHGETFHLADPALREHLMTDRQMDRQKCRSLDVNSGLIENTPAGSVQRIAATR